MAIANDIDQSRPPGATKSDAPARLPAPLFDRQRRLIEYLRISVTDRCNYRCTYCLPEDGVTHARRAEILSFEEITRLVSCFTRLGVHRLRLTGGEPTVRRDLPLLVEMLRRLPGIDDLALSTNGHLLGELAGPLRRAGVDRLNVSVDTLDPGRFARITRGGDLRRVLDGIEAARALGYAGIKINAVAVRGFNHDELAAICTYAWQRDLVPRFIEQMPMADGALFVPGAFMSAAEIRSAIAAAHPGARLSAVPASPGAGAGPARYWRVEAFGGGAGGAGGPGDGGHNDGHGGHGGGHNDGHGGHGGGHNDGHGGHGGGHNDGHGGHGEERRFGVISAMTEHFCDTCNRVRLSASGALHTCLAHDDVTDLRAVLRDGGEDAVVETIRTAVAGKRDGHTFGLVGIGGPRKAMIQIGG